MAAPAPRFQVVLVTDDEATARKLFASAPATVDHAVLMQATNPALPAMMVTTDESFPSQNPAILAEFNA